MSYNSYKLISGEFDHETGISAVTIQYDNGEKYTGTAKLHPDDISFASEYYGCHLAECRAIEKWAKKHKKEYTILLKAYKDIYHHYCLSSIDSKRLKNKIENYQKEIEYFNRVISNIKLTENIARAENLAYRSKK